MSNKQQQDQQIFADRHAVIQRLVFIRLQGWDTSPFFVADHKMRSRYGRPNHNNNNNTWCCTESQTRLLADDFWSSCWLLLNARLYAFHHYSTARWLPVTMKPLSAATGFSMLHRPSGGEYCLDHGVTYRYLLGHTLIRDMYSRLIAGALFASAGAKFPFS